MAHPTQFTTTKYCKVYTVRAIVVTLVPTFQRGNSWQYRIQHRLLYLSPKHWTSAIPEPYQQWLRLIQDSLDE